ncbi:MAG: excinuclease ABC subunit UvrA, partial [Chloroflexota bacterium]|nr:excinuclease ABC subunit UvrA [Chloroflexota bacterium]
MPQDKIVIRGAREHNLKNIDVTIPRDKLVVITGLSGSGKSSLAFDTIFAEGQRRYVESLSAYARQFLDKMEKPDVDHIDGLSPAISIDQKGTTHNPRSTVGTVTEIYDYLRLLYARVGHPHCPNCGRAVSRQTVEQIVDAILNLPEGSRIMLLAPLIQGRKGEYKHIFEEMRRSGYVRARVDGKILDLSDEIDLDKQKKHTIEVVVDRLVIRKGQQPQTSSPLSTAPAQATEQQDGHGEAPSYKQVAERPTLYDVKAREVEQDVVAQEEVDQAFRQRLSDSLETTLKLGNGVVLVSIIDGEEILYSENFACV